MTTNQNTPKTLKEALAQGYKLADTAWANGYVSRKIEAENASIEVAGGVRKGDLYAAMPSWRSTRYYLRQYLTPPTTE